MVRCERVHKERFQRGLISLLPTDLLVDKFVECQAIAIVEAKVACTEEFAWWNDAEGHAYEEIHSVGEREFSVPQMWRPGTHRDVCHLRVPGLG